MILLLSKPSRTFKYVTNTSRVQLQRVMYTTHAYIYSLTRGNRIEIYLDVKMYAHYNGPRYLTRYVTNSGIFFFIFRSVFVSHEFPYRFDTRVTVTFVRDFTVPLLFMYE